MKPFYEQRRPVWVYHQYTLDFPLHLHDAVEIVYVLKGSTTAICDNRRFSLKPGDIFVAFPNQVHGYENTRDFETYMLIITSQNLREYRTLLEQKQPAHPVIHPAKAEAEAFLMLIRQMQADRNQASPPMMLGYSLVLFGRLLPALELIHRSGNADALQAALLYIGEHYREPISREDLAQAIGYSESYISHLFSQLLGTSLTEYIITLRLSDAKKLLRETSLSVGQIAMSLGFPSIRSFNRFFAQKLHTTPSRYRKETGD